jgi:hypothetical protein
MNRLNLGVVKKFAQDLVDELGLRQSAFIGGAPNQLLVVVRDDELLIILRKGPGAYIAVQRTPSTGVALNVIALLAERLPIFEVVQAPSGTGDFVVRAKPHIRLLPPTRSALIVVFLFQLSPVRLAQFSPGLALLAYFQVLQLVPATLFSDRYESFFTLQFSHPTKDVFIRFLAFFSPEGVHGCANLLFTKHWSWNPVSPWPKCFKDDRIYNPVARGRIDKSSLGISKPFFPTGLRFARSCPRGKKKSLASSRLDHFAAVL